MEKIISIQEARFSHPGRYGNTNHEGYEVITDKQVIRLGIDEDNQCCENYGYFMTNDNIQEFVGASLVGVNIVDESLNVTTLSDLDESDTSTMFVNIETNRGTLQFTAYNEHNGYYSHEAVVVSEQLKHSEYL